MRVLPFQPSSGRKQGRSMELTQEARRWSDLFAARTRAGVGEGIAAILALAGDTRLIPFAGGFPDPQTFPASRAAALLEELVASGDESAFQYAPTRGLLRLLDALTDRLEETQGRRPGEGELMVTSGGIEALELVGKSLLDAGDAVVVEAPTYLGAIMAFRSFEAEIVPVPVEDDGLDVETLARRLAGGLRPKLLYAIPDHQNPAGVTLSEERRRALVELAVRYGFLVVEDVAYRDLAFDGTALPSLWSLGPDVVVQAGTTSKTFFPGVRLGWATGPADVLTQLVAAKQNTDQCAGALGQCLFEGYVRRGWIDEQLARSRALYARRCELMLAALERSMPPQARWTRPSGGFFSWLTLPGLDAADLARRAVDRGVAVVPGTPFFPDGGGRENLRLSFSRVADDLIDEGIERLAAAVAAEMTELV
ncbi:MAG TPA: PLP-dependent aminotransferase family protein [Gaiellaceae bacterium]|nr:PLP-dependent aminotransferase family protein [Gaiellaceae bacterium]